MIEDYGLFVSAANTHAEVSTHGQHAVASVSWNDAMAYAAWLSRESAEEYRLPSEAETP